MINIVIISLRKRNNEENVRYMKKNCVNIHTYTYMCVYAYVRDSVCVCVLEGYAWMNV